MKQQINPYKKYRNANQQKINDQYKAKINMNFFMRTGFVMDPIPSITARNNDMCNFPGQGVVHTQKSIKATNLTEFAAQLANS